MFKKSFSVKFIALVVILFFIEVENVFCDININLREKQTVNWTEWQSVYTVNHKISH